MNVIVVRPKDRRVARATALKTAVEYAESSQDTEFLRRVPCLSLAESVVCQLVLRGMSLQHLLVCVNMREDWADKLYRIIVGKIEHRTKRWYEFVEALFLLGNNEGLPMNFSPAVTEHLQHDPFAQSHLLKKYGEEAVGEVSAAVWMMPVRERIEGGDFTRAFDEAKKLIPSSGDEESSRVNEVEFRTLVRELYAAMAERHLVPQELTPASLDANTWSERSKWKSTVPAVFHFLGFRATSSFVSPELAMWYVMKHWRADKKRPRR